jgi:alanyl-tRNA synthetase
MRASYAGATSRGASGTCTTGQLGDEEVAAQKLGLGSGTKAGTFVSCSRFELPRLLHWLTPVVAEPRANPERPLPAATFEWAAAHGEHAARKDPVMLTSNQLRSEYLEFFGRRGHAVIPSASLVPANDPTVLFTTAGMHPLVPNLLGEPHPAGARLVNVQKCIRTGDIDLIGDDTHLTFFEMLGNWSLGDYYREDAIRWSFEFLVDRLKLPVHRIGVTCFAGDDEVPRDDDSATLWRSLGIEQVRFLGRDDNWWGPAGTSGPCGPDTEMFFITEDGRWIEIWNDVFMGYTKLPSGAIERLPRSNVDTGMGLERTLSVINGLSSVYEVDTVAPIHAATGDRVVTDHLRAACFLIADGVVPSNKDRGYVLRRLLRRCLLSSRALPSHLVVDTLGDVYPELVRERSAITDVVDGERTRFDRAVAQGERALRNVRVLHGKTAFDLFQTHGIPLEITLELARKSNVVIDREDFERALGEHRELSRTTSSGAFAGGLADGSEEIVRYHTLTHMLQAALREVLGDQVIQRGSNITSERLRFDFACDRKPTPEELARVEGLVNAWLSLDLEVTRSSMTEREARALGAIGAFGEKYVDPVSVYTIRDRERVLSREFCGGPHVAKLPRGTLQITREQGLSAGVRRIKAVFQTFGSTGGTG